MPQNATPKRVSKTILLATVKKTAGNISEIAQILGWGLDRKKVYRYIKKYELEIELEDARELLADLAESRLKRAINEGDIKSCWKVLSTLGKKRGYSERYEIERHYSQTASSKPNGERSNLDAVEERMREALKDLDQEQEKEIERRVQERLKQLAQN